MNLLSPLYQRMRNYKREIVNDTLLEITRRQLNTTMLTSTETGVTQEQHLGDTPLVVSLTTYSKRIYDVHLTIETLFAQTMKANAIILWLDEQEFTPDTVPLALRRQQKRGLDIRYCKNIRSYKKLVPTLTAFPDAAVVTVDDDTLYPYDMLERLVEAYLRDPHCIYFNRGNLMRMDASGMPLPYEQWGKLPDNVLQEHNATAQAMRKKSHLAFPTGAGGVLYPPHSLHRDVTDDALFMRLCPGADDLWFKMMALKQGTPAALTYSHVTYAQRFLTLPEGQDIALMNTNLHQATSGNDGQLLNILHHYDVTMAELIVAAEKGKEH